MLNEFIEVLRGEFNEEVVKQTSWGRNQIKLAFEQIVNRAALKYLAEAGNTDSLKEE